MPVKLHGNSPNINLILSQKLTVIFIQPYLLFYLATESKYAFMLTPLSYPLEKDAQNLTIEGCSELAFKSAPAYNQSWLLENIK